MSQILVVEGELFLGRLVGLTLLEAGFEVALVKEPEDVHERLSSTAPDVIVFNTGLPAGRKSEFIRGWRATREEIKVVEISEYPLIAAADTTSVDVGKADVYLTPPIRWEALPDVVRQCLTPEQT